MIFNPKDWIYIGGDNGNANGNGTSITVSTYWAVVWNVDGYSRFNATYIDVMQGYNPTTQQWENIVSGRIQNASIDISRYKYIAAFAVPQETISIS